MIYALMICFAWNILNAEHDARRIKKHKEINHPMNAGFYIALVIVICFLVDWKIFLACLCLRPLVFDNYLNLRRGLPLTYQPVAPKSKVDKMENLLFGKAGWGVSNLIYLILFIAGLFIAQL